MAKKINNDINFTSALKWGAISGIGFGILGIIFSIIANIPILGCLTICVCWLPLVFGLGAGIAAAYMYAKENNGDPLIPGVVTGLIAGILAGIIPSIITTIMVLLNIGGTAMGIATNNNSLTQLATGAGSGILGLGIGIILAAIVGAILGVIGGAIGALIKDKM